MDLPVSGVVLYVKDIPAVATFYQKHFGCVALPAALPGFQELQAAGGFRIALHQAAKSQKSGAAMKLVFDVEDVAAFKADCAQHGLVFGATHQASGYEFANAKDPAGNFISISSRSFKRSA